MTKNATGNVMLFLLGFVAGYKPARWFVHLGYWVIVGLSFYGGFYYGQM
jgi:hypothetical protein